LAIGRRKKVLAPTTRSTARGMPRAVLIAAALAVAVSCVALSVASVRPAEAAFAGKNGWITYTRLPVVPQFLDSEIYKMLPDGSSQKQITNNEIDDGRPAWSPDGTKIAFTRSNLFVRDTTTGQTVRLTEGAGLFGINHAHGPSWSHDGTKIAFSKYDGEDSEIYTVNSSDGSGLTQLTDNQVDDLYPIFSPDDTKILFEDRVDLWIMDADGTDRQNFTTSPNTSESQADWSPDGTRIIFEKYPTLEGDPSSDIVQINADGTGEVNLTKTPGVSEETPAWSPNGNKIAMKVTPDVYGDIWKMNADGTHRTSLTNTPEDSEGFPDWQPIPTPSG
jgi:Tol biopolymer transport system component